MPLLIFGYAKLICEIEVAVLGDYLYMEGGETSTYVDGQMQHGAPSVPCESRTPSLNIASN